MAREKGGPWIKLCAAVFYPLTYLLGKPTAQGLANIPKQGGALLVMNHVSHLDPIYDAVFTHRAKRVPRFMAKNTLWKVPVVGKVLAGAGQIPVYRGTADAQQSLAAAEQALRDGKIVIIYPEGTISKDPESWPMHARTGVARLVLGSEAPVIPIARFGTQRVWNGYTKKFRPLPRKRIDFVVGEPVDVSAFRGKEQEPAVLREITDLVMRRVRDLVSDIRGEPAPAEFYSVSKAAKRTAASSETTSASGSDESAAEATGPDKKTGPDKQ